MTSENFQAAGFAGTITRAFIHSRLTPLFITASLLLGIMAIVLLPREEEPQIKVPMIDVMVEMPGASPKEVEERVSIPMEKLLYELPDVEYIYSTSMKDKSLLVVRFYVGTDLESSIVSLNQKLASNFDRIPHSVSKPLIKPHSIDDVPVLAITLHSSTYDHFMLRRLASQLDDSIKNIKDVAETHIIGGNRRQLRILFDPLRLNSRNLTITEVIPKIHQANRQSYVGSLQPLNNEIELQTGSFLKNVEDVGRVVVGVYAGKPVYLMDVATLIDGAEEPDNYVLYGDRKTLSREAAVTLSIAKRPGANAVRVVKDVVKKMHGLQDHLIPDDVKITITRNYGETAAEKSNELLLHMGIAVFGVALLILLFLGWRESVVVMLAIPSTLALTLLIFYLYGYTLNRITLFALIFSIGILVDDAIVVVENIVRHIRLPGNTEKPFTTIATEAVSEVGNPTILATWAVIAAILPMAFVGGLMGPYMRPIPIGATAAMLFSLAIAFTVTPWAAVRILKRKHFSSTNNEVEKVPDDIFTRLYHRIMDPLLAHSRWRIVFFLIITTLLLLSFSLVYFGMVKVKMLPFDNKSEFQVILNMPEGATLEQTSRVALEMSEAIVEDPAVANFQVYVGTASPFNFNGLVRHYFQRSGPTVADIQVNLLAKHNRDEQSHAIAQRIRPAVSTIADNYGAAVAVAEVPPGPPVLQTLVAEIYGPTPNDRLQLARKVKEIFNTTEGVVDVDWFQETERSRKIIIIDKEKAALNGVSEALIARTIGIGTLGESVDLLHMPREKDEINIVFELPRQLQTHLGSLLNISVKPDMSPQAPLVPLRELVHRGNRSGTTHLQEKSQTGHLCYR